MNQQRLVYQCKVQKSTNSNNLSSRQLLIYEKMLVFCKVNQNQKNIGQLTDILEQYELPSPKMKISWQYKEQTLNSFKIYRNGSNQESATYFAEEKYLNRVKTLLDAKTFYYKFYNQYEVLSILSQRKSSQITKCQNMFTKQIKAAKIIKINSKDPKNSEAEISIKMKNYPHKYILNSDEIFLEDDQLILIMDFCEGGTLFNYFSFHDFKIPLEQVIKIMRKVLKAISHLHDLNIIHRDLKQDNIMLKYPNNINSIKIIDFGLAIEANQKTLQVQCGTPGYIAPEILNGQPYNQLCDIYSLGCLYHCLISGQKLFPQNISRTQLFQLNKLNKIRISDKIENNQAKDLIKKMLNQQNERPSADDCLNHSIFKKNTTNYNNNTIEEKLKAMYMPDLKNPFSQALLV